LCPLFYFWELNEIIQISSMETAATASSSMQASDVLPTKKAPAKDPPIRPDSKTTDQVLQKFTVARSDSRPTI
jgi:hypothetical protein